MPGTKMKRARGGGTLLLKNTDEWKSQAGLGLRRHSRTEKMAIAPLPGGGGGGGHGVLLQT